jgi:hypothetical protein
MHGVTGDDMPGHVEFLQQLLHGGDLVGFFIDFDMSQNQRRIDRERAEHLPCLDVVEGVETGLERLAVERNDARLGACRGQVQVRGVLAKDLSTSAALSPARCSGWPCAPAASSI